MNKRLANTSIAFGVLSCLYNVAFGAFFGFLINLFLAIIDAIADTGGVWPTVFLLGGIVVMGSSLVDIVAMILVKRKPLVAGILFAVTAAIFVTYSALVMSQLFTGVVIGLAAAGIVLHVISLTTAFAAAKSARPAPQEDVEEEQQGAPMH